MCHFLTFPMAEDMAQFSMKCVEIFALSYRFPSPNLCLVIATYVDLEC